MRTPRVCSYLVHTGYRDRADILHSALSRFNRLLQTYSGSIYFWVSSVYR